jgi:hypothetical protein
MKQCTGKVAAEVAAGRMQEPGGKQVKDSWSKAELLRLSKAVSRDGRDWVAVSLVTSISGWQVGGPFYTASNLVDCAAVMAAARSTL